MNKKAFTLVELLGVLVILIILGLLIIPSISKNIIKTRNESYQNMIETIKFGTNEYITDNIGKVENDLYNNNVSNVLLSKLQTDGYVTKELKNPKTNSLASGSINVKITRTTGGKNYIIDVEI